MITRRNSEKLTLDKGFEMFLNSKLAELKSQSKGKRDIDLLNQIKLTWDQMNVKDKNKWTLKYLIYYIE